MKLMFTCKFFFMVNTSEKRSQPLIVVSCGPVPPMFTYLQLLSIRRGVCCAPCPAWVVGGASTFFVTAGNWNDSTKKYFSIGPPSGGGSARQTGLCWRSNRQGRGFIHGDIATLPQGGRISLDGGGQPQRLWHPALGGGLLQCERAGQCRGAATAGAGAEHRSARAGRPAARKRPRPAVAAALSRHTAGPGAPADLGLRSQHCRTGLPESLHRAVSDQGQSAGGSGQEHHCHRGCGHRSGSRLQAGV